MTFAPIEGLIGSNDTLSGDNSANKIYGPVFESGVDVLYGRGGNDIFHGDGPQRQAGRRRGSRPPPGSLGGADFFVFSSALGGGNVDAITDFRPVDDTISLETAVFAALATTGALAPDAFRANTAGLAADATDRIVYEIDGGKLFYDANGSASGGGIHFATLTGLPAITPADFAVT